ncbi:UDP-4-amino-4,6-dideoxy-N-acetyl-beta-L-altrosamine transaminase [Longitalea arenae]|uniref:UDP-4-amino-4, 6-dideoxy-N-acetyl-beta-L-altrosamine transaminase n=1 Tax=Longitalea arenae TaxID=2812558 RepID=UPI001968769A|nr:UDP-4-amino-4,6-dideoxy-N-acetyl-beta-L-altrosamine transaminase [Longitalea arenae]
MKPIPYGRQHITESDIEAVITTLTSDFLTQGPTIEEFEKAFAKYIGCQYAVAVSNGTAALHLAAMAMQAGENTNVITSPITFAASANCVRYCGGNVFFADIDANTFCLDIEKVEALIQSKPKGFFHGIIPVDLAGYPVNLESFRQLADQHGLWIIEDSCHAPGGYIVDSKGTKQYCGNGIYSDLAIFSFHPVKHIACGEGGMITTNNEALYKKLLLLRTHGITKDASLMHENHGGWYYEMQELGYNYRLTDFQAALGLSQLKRANEGLEKRRSIASVYNEAFKNRSFIKGQSGVVEGHAYHLYVIRTAKRKELYDFLRARNIFCQVHYIPVHTLPYYQSLGWKKGAFPEAEQYYQECLSLPMYPTLKPEEQEFVINSVIEFHK